MAQSFVDAHSVATYATIEDSTLQQVEVLRISFIHLNNTHHLDLRPVVDVPKDASGVLRLYRQCQICLRYAHVHASSDIR